MTPTPISTVVSGARGTSVSARARALLLVFLVATASLSIACSTGSSSADGAGDGRVVGYAPSPPPEVGRRSLPDHSNDPAGDPFPIRAATGDLLVVYFGFLSCPDICPLTMTDTAAGIADLPPAHADRIEVAFVTVDPERDTGPRLVDYLSHFFPDTTTHSLRAADTAQLDAVTTAFGVQWQVDPHEPGATTYGVAHTGSTYVVDDQGRVVWVIPFGTPGPDVAATLAHVLTTTYGTPSKR